ncbi:unnamed protein product [Protopolystoma xenopodis]|uniref:C2H2-type domain-containing protein n=1 Tax=Protopolystoma xenopodis TaxID=117903 RepID=A0A448WEB3_9PLAT|nr:unnamed protein product [Protopolystoma xenopodis]
MFFALLLLLLRACATLPTNITCDRRASRVARRIIDENIFPLFEYLGVPVDSKCPLNPTKDIFRRQELMKARISERDWECLYCKKRFSTEYYLDKHMDARHSTELYMVVF